MLTPPKLDAEQRKAIARRKSQLKRVAPLEEQLVHIPDSNVTFAITRPMSIDAVLDYVIDDPEQNLPYWAEIWPSGIALAAMLLGDQSRIRGLPVIELGSGIGITAVAALMAGADLTITDYSLLSLLLAEMNCLRAGQTIPSSRQVNWRDPRAHMLQENGEQWPVVLAADVLYEQRDMEPVLDVLDRITSPDGVVLLAEPGRRQSREALDMAAQRGWWIETRKYTGPWPDSHDAEVIVNVHTIRKYRIDH